MSIAGPRRAATQGHEPPTAEHSRLAESPLDSDPWRLWGPYVSGRQWGTVREDYSADGDAWAAFPFDQAHRRAYRWGEDGIAGLCDRYGFLNLGVALWNRHDDRLKERYFGLTNPQGNHGEDVKEYWFHLDGTPTHSWAQMLYRYPQAAFPYEDLVATNAARTKEEDEYELADTGVLAGDRFFDVVVTHAKAGPQDICVTIEATNHGPDAAPLDVIAQLWFRNTWAWGLDDRVPVIQEVQPTDMDVAGARCAEAEHGFLGTYRLLGEGDPDLLFCDNETDAEALWGQPNRTPYPKSGIDRAVVHGDRGLLNPHQTGTKVGFHYAFDAVGPSETVTVRLRLTEGIPGDRPFGEGFDSVLADRRAEADDFYREVIPAACSAVDADIARRAFAGLQWNKQLYRYEVERWLEGDPPMPSPPERRLHGRNSDWSHLYLADVISMPDEWEYPWFASWDLAFHCVTLAHVDPAFAKNQLILMCREWAQHPSGQLPAYEWSFEDVNPPVHAWAAWQVYKHDGRWDHEFLVRVFGKLLMNFTWWVNRKDADGSNLFEGGFLGMDNIGVFDRSKSVPAGYRLEQSDATSWMAFYCLSMLRIALELSRRDRAWDDLATSFLERFVSITRASRASGRAAIWDPDDGFFYDTLVADDGTAEPVRVRSLVGLLPLLAVANVPEWVGEELPDFTARLHWLRRNIDDDAAAVIEHSELHGVVTLGLTGSESFGRVVATMLDESEFLSDHGIRSLSAVYREGATFDVAGTQMSIRYDPGESTSGLFGGNSNWRGPVWFPVNMLLADAMRTFSEGVGRDASIECPTGSGVHKGLLDIAYDIDERLISLFRPGPDGRRPSDPHDHGTGALWSLYPVFSEYFHGDTGRGLGASHQTGWTALVAHLICVVGRKDQR